MRKTARDPIRRDDSSFMVESEAIEMLLAIAPVSPPAQRPATAVVDVGSPTYSYPSESSTTGTPVGLLSANDEPSQANANSQRTDESVSNPLGLLADASGEAQGDENFISSDSSSTTTQTTSLVDSTYQSTMAPVCSSVNAAQSLLRRPGYVSLGLKLDRGILDDALRSLSTLPNHMGRYANYFKAPAQTQTLDTGPELDPVDLGLVSEEEVQYLFPM